MLIRYTFFILFVGIGFQPASLLMAETLERYHLSEDDRAHIQTAIDSAAKWLVKHQQPNGAFQSTKENGAPALALTGMALWALSQSEVVPQACDAAAAHLLSFQQEDGGIYDPTQGFVRYTAAVARQGLQTWAQHRNEPSVQEALEQLNLFVYRHQSLESLADAEKRAAPGQITAEVEQMLQRDDLSPDIRKALEFLMAARRKATDQTPSRLSQTSATDESNPAITYDELLRYMGEISNPDNPTVWKTYYALRAYYRLDGNPDLTKRYGPDGFQDKSAGLYHYYLTAARTLGTVSRPELKMLDGTRHDWAKELSQKLISLQNDEGFWVNENPRWLEGDPLLVTCYVMISLSICRDVKVAKP